MLVLDADHSSGKIVSHPVYEVEWGKLISQKGIRS